MQKKTTPLFYVVLICLVLMSAGPVILMLSASFKLNINIMSGGWSVFFMPTLANYEKILCDLLWYEPSGLDYCDPTFSRSLVNSLIISTSATFITLIIGCMGAYALVRFKFMGRDMVSFSTLAMRMVPPAVLLVPMFGIWTFQFGLDGTHIGLILIYVAMNLPFVIWILQSFIVQIPIQLEEAAKMDGARPFQIFFKVVFPLIKPGLAAAFMLTYRVIWNEFLLANALGDRGTRTVPVFIVNNITETETDWGAIMATGMLLAIPPIIFTLLASRQIITGMTAGAVKG